MFDVKDKNHPSGKSANQKVLQDINPSQVWSITNYVLILGKLIWGELANDQ